MKLSRLLESIAAILAGVYTLARWFALLALACLALQAQATHQVTLSWTDTANPAGTTYNVYRQTGSCPPGQIVNPVGWTKLTTTPITAMSFADASVVGGMSYCYVITAVSGTSESVPSNSEPAQVPGSFPPVQQPPLVR